MKFSAYVKDLGTITYEEPFFGKMKIYVNGVLCEKVGKKQYLYVGNDDKRVVFSIKGNFVAGMTVEKDGQTYTVVEKPKWYELVLYLLPLIFIIVWGNNVILVKMLPVFGGAIGGAIGGIFACCTMVVSRTVKPVWLKILIGLGIFALSIIVNNVLATAFLRSL